MIFDKSLQFSDAQVITATAASTNSIDFGPGGRVYGAAADIPRDIARSVHLPLLIQVVEAFNTLTSLTISLELDTTTTFTPDKTIQLASIPLANLTLGAQVYYAELPQGISMRYARLKYTVVGTDPTTGKITAGIVDGVQSNGTP